MGIYYGVMENLEKGHPAVLHAMETLGDKNYTDLICAIVFGLCISISQLTMPTADFEKMIDRISSETIEIDTKKLD